MEERMEMGILTLEEKTLVVIEKARDHWEVLISFDRFHPSFGGVKTP